MDLIRLFDKQEWIHILWWMLTNDSRLAAEVKDAYNVTGSWYMRMTSSKCVLHQRHLLGYESEPLP